MITQEQAQELYETLDTLAGSIDEQDQFEIFCSVWCLDLDVLGRKCDRGCPMSNSDGNKCALEDARELIRRIDYENL